jgi:hypothetical protein
MKLSRWCDGRRPRSCRGRARGQAQVEFALVAVLLMVLVLSMIELLSLVNTYNVLADSAKEGVRYGIVHGTNNSIPSGPICNPGGASDTCQDIDGPPAPPGTVPGYGSGYGVVMTYAQYSLHDISNMTVNVAYPDAATATKPSNATPNRVQVTVAYPFKPLFGLGWPTVTVYAAAEGRIMN